MAISIAEWLPIAKFEMVFQAMQALETGAIATSKIHVIGQGLD